MMMIMMMMIVIIINVDIRIKTFLQLRYFKIHIMISIINLLIFFNELFILLALS